MKSVCVVRRFRNSRSSSETHHRFVEDDADAQPIPANTAAIAILLAIVFFIVFLRFCGLF
jgi:hypothetical protein